MESYQNATAETERLLKHDAHLINYGDDDLHNNTAEGSFVTKTGLHKRRTRTGEESPVKFNKMRLFSTFIFLIIIYVLSVFTQPISKSSFDYQGINTIISFGDSYTTRYLNMESLTYACRNCTSAGGPNWVIYLTDAKSWISWDFAYNSAPVNNSIVNQVPTVIDVSTQVRDLYRQIFVSPSKKISAIVASQYKDKVRTPKSTLTTIWVGINDIDLTYDWKETKQLDHLIMQRYQALINELIQEGVNQFMLINVPPLDRAPMWHNTVNEKLIKSRVADYNKKLKGMTKSLKKSHSSAIFFEYDAWNYFNELMDHAKDYDMTAIDTYCPDWSHPVENKCKPIGEYFWLNDLHPTFHVHQLMAKDVERYLSSQ